MLIQVHRKPSFIRITIPNDSFHPSEHKASAYNYMIHGSFLLPLSELDLKERLQTIENVSINNKPSIKSIHKLQKN